MKRGIIWAAVSTKPQADEDEKFSIPKQIADGEAFFRANNIQLVDTLVVPGHSRSYKLLSKLAEHARAQHIDAFDRLIDHLERCDFDVIWVRDANRFARKASLLHYIAESIIEDCGALIYSQNDGLWVDGDNVDMWATMQGFKVRSEMKWLVAATREGLIKRAERGLTTTNVPFSHRLVRDERLKPIAVEVDETKRRLFDDLWYLIVKERQPFNGIERVLFERFGHVAADGKPYGNNVMYVMLHSPLAWGITTYTENRGNKRTFGAWMFDPTEPPPPDILVFRDTVAPVYTGEQADALRAELLRRKEMRGRRRPDTLHWSSGLFICRMCNWTMRVASNIYNGKRTVYGVRCNTRAVRFQFRPPCSQRKPLPLAYAQEYIDALLRLYASTRDLSILVPGTAERDGSAAVRAELAAVSQQLDNLITLQSQAHAGTQAAYQRRIDALGAQLEALERRARELDTQQSRRATDAARAAVALDTIASIMDTFWSLPDAEINQYLLRALGRYRFAVEDGKIVGVMLKPQRQRRKPM